MLHFKKVTGAIVNSYLLCEDFKLKRKIFKCKGEKEYYKSSRTQTWKEIWNFIALSRLNNNVFKIRAANCSLISYVGMTFSLIWEIICTFTHTHTFFIFTFFSHCFRCSFSLFNSFLFISYLYLFLYLLFLISLTILSYSSLLLSSLCQS